MTNSAPMTETEAIAFVEGHFSLRLKRDARGSYRSLNGCPWCGDGGKGSRSNRFYLMMNGRNPSPRVWCRKCEGFAFLDELDGTRLTPEQIEERKQAVARRQAVERERQKRRLARVAAIDDHLVYHKNLENPLYGHAVDWWLAEGINIISIFKRQLGYAPQCPSYPSSGSFTIPVMYRGNLWNISHRLETPNDAGKYRRHVAGVPNILFSADVLEQEDSGDRVLLVEGEKKTIVVQQETGVPTVGVMGANAFEDRWAEQKFNSFARVIVAMDPDKQDEAHRIAKLFNGRGLVATFPVKPDDFFTLYGGTTDDFLSFLNQARRPL